MRVALFALIFSSLSVSAMQSPATIENVYNQLTLLIEQNKFDAFKKLIIENKYIVNHIHVDGKTILFWSVSYNRFGFVKLLLDQDHIEDKIINLKDRNSSLIPLWLACRLDNKRILVLFFKKCKYNINTEIEGHTIFDMVQSKDNEISDFLRKAHQED